MQRAIRTDARSSFALKLFPLPYSPVGKYYQVVLTTELGATQDWTCGSIDQIARAGGFTSSQCSYAQSVAAKMCACEHTPATPAPVSVVPPCQVCSANQIVETPNLLVQTVLGVHTCAGKHAVTCMIRSERVRSMHFCFPSRN